MRKGHTQSCSTSLAAWLSISSAGSKITANTCLPREAHTANVDRQRARTHHTSRMLIKLHTPCMLATHCTQHTHTHPHTAWLGKAEAADMSPPCMLVTYRTQHPHSHTAWLGRASAVGMSPHECRSHGSVPARRSICKLSGNI
eukprot:1156529-Pelagomonas_calceolata.AAC.6